MLHNNSTKMPSQINDLAVIDKITKGDIDSYKVLYKKYWNFLYQRMYNSVGKDIVIAEELTAITLEKAYINIETYKNTHTFMAWLNKIAKNTLIDYYRTKGNNETVSIDSEMNFSSQGEEDMDNAQSSFDIKDNAPTPDEVFIKNQRKELLHAAIASLDKKTRTAINLIVIKEMTYEEASNKMKETVENVKVLVFRAKKQIALLINKNII